MIQPDTIKNHAAFIWSVADLLRGQRGDRDFFDEHLRNVIVGRRGAADRAAEVRGGECGRMTPASSRETKRAVHDA